MITGAIGIQGGIFWAGKGEVMQNDHKAGCSIKGLISTSDELVAAVHVQIYKPRKFIWIFQKAMLVLRHSLKRWE